MKRYSIILFCYFTLLFLNGCYDANYIERNVAVLAIGVDKADDGPYEISFHLDSQKASGEKEEGKEKDKNAQVVTQKGDGILSALQKQNDAQSVNIDISHTKMIMFSEGVAKDGIEQLLNELFSSYRLENNPYVVIAENRASEILKKIKPEEETYTSVYYQTILHKKYKTTKKDFLAYQVFFDITDKDKKTVTLPIVKVYDDEVEFSGSAVLFGDKMINSLTEEEELTKSLIKGDIQRRSYEISDKDKKEEPIVILLTQEKRPKINAQIENGTINVDIKLYLTGLYQTRLNTKSNKDFIQSYIQEKCSKLIESSKQSGIDILSVKELLKPELVTSVAIKDFDFFKAYRDAKFNINVDITLPQENAFKEV